MDKITTTVYQGSKKYVWHGHMFATKADAEAYRDKMKRMHQETAALYRRAEALGIDLDAE